MFTSPSSSGPSSLSFGARGMLLNPIVRNGADFCDGTCRTQAQVVAARKEPGDYLSVAWGWGVGFMLAIYVSSGISGGHMWVPPRARMLALMLNFWFAEILLLPSHSHFSESFTGAR